MTRAQRTVQKIVKYLKKNGWKVIRPRGDRRSQ